MIRSFSIQRALLAALSGTVAMTILMYGWPLVGLPSMDIMAALGGVFPFGLSPYILGSIIHFGMGIGLGLTYVVFFDSWLPGPGWFRGALFSLVPWVFAITLLGPTLQMGQEFFSGRQAIAANPCAVANPGQVPNPCAVLNPCAVNPGAVKQSPPNPCAAKPRTPANPCGERGQSSGGVSSRAMSLVVHLLYGGLLGAVYRPKRP